MAGGTGRAEGCWEEGGGAGGGAPNAARGCLQGQMGCGALRPGAALPGVNVRLWRRAAGGRFLFGLVGTWESPASSSHTGNGAGTAGVRVPGS